MSSRHKVFRRLTVTLMCLFSGCAREELTVFTEYVSIESLPSYRIGTPDPHLYCPDIGEKLHIQWSTPKSCHYKTLDLHLSILFGNKEKADEWFSLEKPTGIYVYPLLNKAYWEKGGIFTFRVELYADGLLIKQWRHQLWAERFDIDQGLKITPSSEGLH